MIVDEASVSFLGEGSLDANHVVVQRHGSLRIRTREVCGGASRFVATGPTSEGGLSSWSKFGTG